MHADSIGRQTSQNGGAYLLRPRLAFRHLLAKCGEGRPEREQPFPPVRAGCARHSAAGFPSLCKLRPAVDIDPLSSGVRRAEDVTPINLSMMTYEWFDSKRDLYDDVYFPGTHYTMGNTRPWFEKGFAFSGDCWCAPLLISSLLNLTQAATSIGRTRQRQHGAF